MQSDAKIERLQRIPLFANADDDALRHLAEAADEASIAAGSELIGQGHRHHEAYVIVTGSVHVDVDGHRVATIPAGEIVGELGVFVQGPASATVVAAEPTDVLIIPYNRFDQILDDNPALVRRIVEDLAERLYAMDAEHSRHASG